MNVPTIQSIRSFVQPHIHFYFSTENIDDVALLFFTRYLDFGFGYTLDTDFIFTSSSNNKPKIFPIKYNCIIKWKMKVIRNAKMIYGATLNDVLK